MVGPHQMKQMSKAHTPLRPIYISLMPALYLRGTGKTVSCSVFPSISCKYFFPSIMTLSDNNLSGIKYSFLQMQYTGNKLPPGLSFGNSSVVTA